MRQQKKKTASSNGNETTEASESLEEEVVEKNLVRFYVRSLGWVKISEEDLTPERSSRAVNKCINDLSRGTKGFDDVVARWGDVRISILVNFFEQFFSFGLFYFIF